MLESIGAEDIISYAAVLSIGAEDIISYAAVPSIGAETIIFSGCRETHCTTSLISWCTIQLAITHKKFQFQFQHHFQFQHEAAIFSTSLHGHKITVKWPRGESA